MNLLQNFKAMAMAPSTPSGPKPRMQRPTLLRSRAEGCKSKSETLTSPFSKFSKPEIDTNLLAFELIQSALTEDAKNDGEDDIFYESSDESVDEMDDDVLSLCGQSESEQEEGNLVDLANGFARGVVGQGVALDFTKVIQSAVQENIASNDFLEIYDFFSEEDELAEELGGMEPGQFVFKQDGAGPVETTEAQEVADGLASLRENAKQTLLRAAGDGSLFGALKAVEVARVHQVDAEARQVEGLRREAKDAMLKAARNGLLASALIKMRTVGQVESKAAASEDLEVAESKNVKNAGSDLWISKEEVDKAVAKHSKPVRGDTAFGTSRAMKLAWCMAGSPARSLRQKDSRKALHSRELVGRPSLTAYPFSNEHLTHMDGNSKDAEFATSHQRMPEKSDLTVAVGQPRLSGSTSAVSLGLKRAKVVSVRCASSRSASVGSLRPLKVKGPAPPAVPPTAFLHKHEQIAKQGN